MNFKKYVDISNQIINILNSSDLTFLEGLLILDIIKNEVLKKVRSERK